MKTKIIIDKQKLDILLRLNCPADVIVSALKGEDTTTGDSLTDEILQDFIKVKTFDNWGGVRTDAGRKPQKTGKNNQVEFQVENQVDGQDVDKDIDINNNNNNIYYSGNTHARTHVRDKEPITSAEVNKIVKDLAQNFKSADAIVGAFEYADGKTHEGIKVNNQRLLAFIRKRFDSGILEKVSNWAIDHNQRGYIYNAQALLKLLTRFQRDVEPTINFNFVQNEYIDFQYKTDSESNGKPAENKEK